MTDNEVNIVLTDDEVNKIIAEYMGYSIQETELNNGELYAEKVKNNVVSGLAYTLSLDALVPVWEKLSQDNVYGFVLDPKKDPAFGIEKLGGLEFYEVMDTIQQAAAHATAKIILELKQNKEVCAELSPECGA